MVTTSRASGLALAYAFCLFGALSGIPNQPEHELHLFLADHAFTRYFDLWDSRWYGGFEVVGQPPLAHQLTALLAHLPFANVERAYAVLTVAAGVGWVFAAGLLASRLFGPTAKGRAALLAAASPLLYVFLFPFAQLPFVLGCALGLFASALALEAGPVRLAAAALLALAATLSHPVAALPASLGFGIAAFETRAGRLRALVALPAVAMLNVITLWPFWSGLRATPAQGLSKWEATSGGLALVAVATVCALAMVRIVRPVARQDRPLAAAALLLALLAFHSPVPWVASDKLLWLASAALVLAWAAPKDPAPRFAVPAFFTAVALLALVSAALLGRPSAHVERRRRTALAEVTAFLARPGNARWRYLTLGLGPSRFELLRRAAVGTLDGGSPWMDPPVLAGTGQPSFDALPLDRPEGRAALERVLAPDRGLGLRWVVSANEAAQPLLEAAGFEVRAAFRDQVVLWARDATPALTSGEHTPVRHWAFSCVPPITLVLGVLLAVARLRAPARADAR